MIVLEPGKTTGKEVYRLIMQAVNARAKETGTEITKLDFCREAGLSRSMLHGFSKDRLQPGSDALVKIARGLISWGHKVNFEVKP